MDILIIYLKTIRMQSSRICPVLQKTIWGEITHFYLGNTEMGQYNTISTQNVQTVL